MWLRNAFRVIGILLMLFSLSMLPPVLVSWLYGDDQHGVFLLAFAVVLGLGLSVWLPNLKQVTVLRPRDGFLITVLVYVVLGLGGALPLYFSGVTATWTEAAFESLSGLTTTGATVLVGLDDLPHSLLYYRQQLQWLGGMGIVILAVAVLPMLGVGGMQLYRAEIPSANKDGKLTPRITETARALWLIYLTLTIACMVGYALAGMSWFDALCHSFSTVAIGGFSTHDLSMGWFNNRAVELIAVVFMLLCAINFALHFIAWQRRSLAHYLGDPELRFFVMTLIAGFVAICFALSYSRSESFLQLWPAALFQTVSIATTTGFTTTTFAAWPSFAPLLLLLLALMGGCAGSTAGGLKSVRILLIVQQSAREIRRLIHPHAVYHIKLGQRVVDERIIHAVWGFVAAFAALFLMMLLALMAQDMDFISSFSAVASTLSNLGPGLGSVSANYSETSAVVKWVLCLAMLAGRLEIYTLLVLFSPSFWR